MFLIFEMFNMRITHFCRFKIEICYLLRKFQHFAYVLKKIFGAKYHLMFVFYKSNFEIMLQSLRLSNKLPLE